MRRSLPVAAAALALCLPAAAHAAPPAADLYAPPPDPTVQRIDGTPVVQLDDGAGGLPYLGGTADGTQSSYNAGNWEPNLRNFVATNQYANELTQIDELAVRQIYRRVHAVRHPVRPPRDRRPGRHAGRGAARKPAVVFDVDETLLSNYTAIDKDDFTYGPASQAEATDQIGKQIAPTKRVYDAARAKGVTIFLITGRGEAVREPTAANLAREGFTGYQSLTLKPAGFKGTTVQYKAGARKAIEDQGYTIVANVGDQFSDLAGGHAKVAYKLPNPFYYLP